ncbi:uncharacterized protein RJT20DRAFT_1195 [Scheffersomyces xylosifermentans]|uniref:uncharacterized protein n=1 Tax=Scheffersomyces xylosifermentans TaxID=1304137 RepID=UPI00315C68B7
MQPTLLFVLASASASIASNSNEKLFNLFKRADGGSLEALKASNCNSACSQAYKKIIGTCNINESQDDSEQTIAVLSCLCKSHDNTFWENIINCNCINLNSQLTAAQLQTMYCSGEIKSSESLESTTAKGGATNTAATSEETDTKAGSKVGTTTSTTTSTQTNRKTSTLTRTKTKAKAAAETQSETESEAETSVLAKGATTSTTSKNKTGATTTTGDEKTTSTKSSSSTTKTSSSTTKTSSSSTKGASSSSESSSKTTTQTTTKNAASKAGLGASLSLLALCFL